MALRDGSGSIADNGQIAPVFGAGPEQFRRYRIILRDGVSDLFDGQHGYPAVGLAIRNDGAIPLIQSADGTWWVNGTFAGNPPDVAIVARAALGFPVGAHMVFDDGSVPVAKPVAVDPDALTCSNVLARYQAELDFSFHANRVAADGSSLVAADMQRSYAFYSDWIARNGCHVVLPPPSGAQTSIAGALPQSPGTTGAGVPAVSPTTVQQAGGSPAIHPPQAGAGTVPGTLTPPGGASSGFTTVPPDNAAAASSASVVTVETPALPPVGATGSRTLWVLLALLAGAVLLSGG